MSGRFSEIKDHPLYIEYSSHEKKLAEANEEQEQVVQGNKNLQSKSTKKSFFSINREKKSALKQEEDQMFDEVGLLKEATTFSGRNSEGSGAGENQLQKRDE